MLLRSISASERVCIERTDTNTPPYGDGTTNATPPQPLDTRMHAARARATANDEQLISPRPLGPGFQPHWLPIRASLRCPALFSWRNAVRVSRFVFLVVIVLFATVGNAILVCAQTDEATD